MSVSLIDGHIDDDVEMTDEQIICGLNCCRNNEEYDIDKFCGDCEFASYGKDCKVMLFAKSIDLIKHKNAEIERLEYNIESLEYELEDVKYGDG